jgi:hypothetical protein
LLHNVELILKRQATGAGEADAAAEQIFSHVSSVTLAAIVERLEVHGFPHGARLDVGSVQTADELVPRAAEPFFIDQEATQPIGVKTVRGLWHERDSGKIGEGVAVAECDGAALLDALVEHFQLPAADAG